MDLNAPTGRELRPWTAAEKDSLRIAMKQLAYDEALAASIQRLINGELEEIELGD